MSPKLSFEYYAVLNKNNKSMIQSKNPSLPCCGLCPHWVPQFIPVSTLPPSNIQPSNFHVIAFYIGPSTLKSYNRHKYVQPLGMCCTLTFNLWMQSLCSPSFKPCMHQGWAMTQRLGHVCYLIWLNLINPQIYHRFIHACFGLTSINAFSVSLEFSGCNASIKCSPES